MFHPNSWWWDWNWPRFLRVIVTPFGTQVVSIWNKRGVLLSDILNICRIYRASVWMLHRESFFFFSFSFLIWTAFIFTESHSSQLKGRKKAHTQHSWSWGTRSARLELGRLHLLSAWPAPSRRGLSTPVRPLLLASHCTSGDVPFREPLSGSDSSSLSTSGPGAGGRWSL